MKQTQFPYDSKLDYFPSSWTLHLHPFTYLSIPGVGMAFFPHLSLSSFQAFLVGASLHQV